MDCARWIVRERLDQLIVYVLLARTFHLSNELISMTEHIHLARGARGGLAPRGVCVLAVCVLGCDWFVGGKQRCQTSIRSTAGSH